MHDAISGGSLHGTMLSIRAGEEIFKKTVRWPFREEVVLIPLADSSRERCAAVTGYCRSLSALGAGLIVTEPVRADSEVTVLLPSPLRGSVAVMGQVRGLRPWSGYQTLAEVTWNTPLDTEEFLRIDPLAQPPSVDRVDKRDVQGRLALAGCSAYDKACVRRALRGTGVEVVHASERDALARKAHRLDAVLLALDHPDLPAGDVVVELFANGFSGRLGMLAPEYSAHVRQVASKLPIFVTLVRPFREDALLRAVAQLLQPRRAVQTAA